MQGTATSIKYFTNHSKQYERFFLPVIDNLSYTTYAYNKTDTPGEGGWL